MRVFDCFTFYNEFDMLELRLEELWDTVDYFVISEANTTHQNNLKPFFLKDNWDKIKKYESKIRHVIIEDMPMSSDTWVNERHQRRELRRALTDLQPDDIVIVSDCDEIPRPSAIEAIKEDTNDYDRYILAIPLNYFKLNFMMVHPVVKQNNIAVTRGRAFTDPQKEREFTFHRDLPYHYADNDFCVVEHGGWHFTYFGHNEFAANKLLNFAHAESRNLAETVDVDYMITNKVGFLGFNYHERFEYITVDDYFPQTVLNNLEKYKDMIVHGDTHNIYKFYPE
jgi:beta-1,4-mannosyl-glycoprotein beta-1,4-N-acetylglucosaminyltransferase